MKFGQTAQIAVAAVGGAPVDGLVQAAKAKGWKVSVVKSLQELQALAEASRCHVALIASAQPADLPAGQVRELLSLLADASVAFLLPEGCDLADCLALLGVCSEQIWNIQAPPQELLKSLERDLNWVLSDRPEYAVFCVDDDDEFLASMAELLRHGLAKDCMQFTLDFQFFQNPIEALAAAGEQHERLAVAIADQVMPEMEGTDLLGRIKELSSNTQRVLLTGYASLASAVTALNEGLLDKYLTKPVEEPVDFIIVLRHLIQEYHLRKSAACHRRRLMMQFEFVGTISATSNIEKALTLTAKFVRRELPAAWVMLLLRENNRLVIRAAAGEVPETIAAAGQEELQELLHQRGACCDADSRAWGARHAGPAKGRCPQALLALPLRSGTSQLGMLLAGSEDEQAGFSRNQRVLMSFVCDVASMNIARFQDRQALEVHYVGTLSSLMEAVEAKDPCTRGHTDRVLELAMALGKAAGAKEEFLKDIERAAALHDLGKLAVPDGILRKPGRLEKGEFAIIKEHPVRADRMLRHLRFLDCPRQMIRGHHERYDGKGYPDGLAGEEIPLGARILAIADAYDAMTSTRPYRPAMDSAAAIEEIRSQAGRQFDPVLSALFIETMTNRICQPRQERKNRQDPSAKVKQA